MLTYDVVTVAYNEAFMVPHFLRHYKDARRIFFFDNESTDDTVALARQDPRVEVATFSTGGKYDELTQTEIRNGAWRVSDADWVLVVDMDEFVDLRPLHPWHERYGAAKVAFKCEGRDMVGVDGQRLEDIDLYFPSPGYDKLSVFSPRIGGINYEPGMHTASPTCPIITNPRMILRHYCHIGAQHCVARFARCKDRQSARNTVCGFGIQYNQSEDSLLLEHEEFLRIAKKDTQR